MASTLQIVAQNNTTQYYRFYNIKIELLNWIKLSLSEGGTNNKIQYSMHYNE